MQKPAAVLNFKTSPKQVHITENVQVGQVPESPEGVFGRSLDLITFNEPVEDKNKSMVDSV